jgi:hypothetical protein
MFHLWSDENGQEIEHRCRGVGLDVRHLQPLPVYPPCKHRQEHGSIPAHHRTVYICLMSLCGVLIYVIMTNPHNRR